MNETRSLTYSHSLMGETVLKLEIECSVVGAVADAASS